MLSFLRKQRNQLDAWLGDRQLAHTFSLTTYGVYIAAAKLIDQYAQGVCLDAGSGRAPYKDVLRARGVQVITIDVEKRGGDLTHVADIQNMPVIASNSIDTVVCTEVLEHVPRPWDAMVEIARVLKPGGYLVLSVPHLSPIHEAPHDYYRYTQYGLQSLLETRGFDVLELKPVGGILAFLGHGASMLFFSTLGAWRPLRPIAWFLNYVLLVRVLKVLDSLVGLSSVYPSNHVVLARRRDGTADTV